MKWALYIPTDQLSVCDSWCGGMHWIAAWDVGVEPLHTKWRGGRNHSWLEDFTPHLYLRRVSVFCVDQWRTKEEQIPLRAWIYGMTKGYKTKFVCYRADLGYKSRGLYRGLFCPQISHETALFVCFWLLECCISHGLKRGKGLCVIAPFELFLQD